MDRAALERYLGRGLSLDQIGVLENRHPSTVGYWVKKHGLIATGRAKHAPRGGLARSEVEPLIERGLAVVQIAREIDRSLTTTRYWLKKWGILPEERKR